MIILRPGIRRIGWPSGKGKLLKIERRSTRSRKTCFGRGYGPVLRQTTEWMNEWINKLLRSFGLRTTVMFVSPKRVNNFFLVNNNNNNNNNNNTKSRARLTDWQLIPITRVIYSNISPRTHDHLPVQTIPGLQANYTKVRHDLTSYLVW
jgi:hypothetical protein